MTNGPNDEQTTVLGVPRGTVWEIGMSLARLTAVGLVAIGVSAVLALCMGAIGGASFVAGDPPGVTYTAERCRDLREYAPEAPSCTQAAAEHHFEETVVYRGAAGVVGLVLAGGYWWVARRRPRQPDLLPAGFEATMGTTAFGLGALVLLGIGADALLFAGGHENGAGAALSGGIVSAALACWFGMTLVRALAAHREPIRSS